MKISEILNKSIIETASSGSTSAANVSTGAIYPNKPAKQTKRIKPNALDTNANLLTGGSITKRI